MKEIKEFEDEGHGTDGPQRLKPEEEPEMRGGIFEYFKKNKIKPEEKIIDIGDSVICDWCGEDYTESDAQGGLLFGSKACCPECAPRVEASAKRFNEDYDIRGRCPDGMTFKDWVLQLRGGENTIKVYTWE